MSSATPEDVQQQRNRGEHEHDDDQDRVGGVHELSIRLVALNRKNAPPELEFELWCTR